MSTLFDNPEYATVIEEQVSEHISKVEISVENGSNLTESLYKETHSLIWSISTKTRRVIHDTGSHDATALALNESYAVMSLWGVRVSGYFDVDSTYWNGQFAGFQMMFTALVERELESLRGSRGVWWTGKRFISEKDLVS
ncbi:hypothetical protein [Glutamicibacter ardleyensis]|uniref:hypothetical protein n=1 Tax=Glutamicibacter ardleyensis TaxID=225894 RepID=UPI003FD21F90